MSAQPSNCQSVDLRCATGYRRDSTRKKQQSHMPLLRAATCPEVARGDVLGTMPHCMSSGEVVPSAALPFPAALPPHQRPHCRPCGMPTGLVARSAATSPPMINNCGDTRSKRRMVDDLGGRRVFGCRGGDCEHISSARADAGSGYDRRHPDSPLETQPNHRMGPGPQEIVLTKSGHFTNLVSTVTARSSTNLVSSIRS